jgi:hypothetical protein
VAGSRAMGRDDVSVRESIPTESPSQETGSFDRHQAGCSLRTPREHAKVVNAGTSTGGLGELPGGGFAREKGESRRWAEADAGKPDWFEHREVSEARDPTKGPGG